MKIKLSMEVDKDTFYDEVAEVQVCLRKVYDKFDGPEFWMKSSAKFPVEIKILDTNGNTVGQVEVTI